MPRININLSHQIVKKFGLAEVDDFGASPEFYFASSVNLPKNSAFANSMKSEVEKYSFRPTLHAPFMHLNLGSESKEIAETTRKELKWAIDTAAFLRADIIVVHPGYTALPEKKTIEHTGWLDNALPNLDFIAKYSEDKGIKLAFENIFDRDPFSLLLIKEAIGTSNIGFCFDTGHYNIFSPLDMQDWLEALDGHIYEFHVHDNDSTGDQHLPIGEGNIDFTSLQNYLVSKEISELPVVTFENKTLDFVKQSLSRIREWEFLKT